MEDILLTVTRSSGADGAVVIFIDTPTFEPTGDPGLRILLNDTPVYEGRAHDPSGDRDADSVSIAVNLSEIGYQS